MNFIPYEKAFTHTHTLHELSLLLKNFYLQGNFCDYWLLTLNYILVYFWNAIWLFYQLFTHACSEANVRKFLFCIFPSAFQLLVWSVRKDMFLRPDALGSVDLLSDSMSSGRVCTTSGCELFAFSAKHTHTHTHTLLFACSIMLCCVCFLSNWSRDFGILCTSFLIPRHFLLTFLILLSFGSF
jgi:hypothetical protein